MTILNDATNWSVTLESSIMLLESSIMLLENIYSSGITLFDHMFRVQATGEPLGSHWGATDAVQKSV
jgi:hypothetical protein